jgi:hypothetical protein
MEEEEEESTCSSCETRAAVLAGVVRSGSRYASPRPVPISDVSLFGLWTLASCLPAFWGEGLVFSSALKKESDVSTSD